MLTGAGWKKTASRLNRNRFHPSGERTAAGRKEHDGHVFYVHVERRNEDQANRPSAVRAHLEFGSDQAVHRAMFDEGFGSRVRKTNSTAPPFTRTRLLTIPTDLRLGSSRPCPATCT